MNWSKFIAGRGALLMMLMAAPTALYGQDREPDIQVMSPDISVHPSSPVKENTNVTFHAYVCNVENCYIVLSDNQDEVGFNHKFERGDFIKLKVKVRSPDNGEITEPIGFQMRIGRSFSTRETTFNKDWSEIDLHLKVPAFDNKRLYLKRVSGSSDYDLEIDHIVIYYEYDWMKKIWHKETTREGESYNSGGYEVDRIYPSNVQVNFFDGNPALEAIKINGPSIAGNVQKLTESGTVMILTEGGKASTFLLWPATGGGWHDIHVDIIPDPRETIKNNNRANVPIQVVSPWWVVMKYLTYPRFR